MTYSVSFILASTDYGNMILNRNDINTNEVSPNGYGVGFELLTTGQFCQDDLDILLEILTLRRNQYGDGVIAIDGGANIGVHTLAYAKHMRGWGEVISYEPQELIYYALAGNVVLNNLFNAHVNNMALGSARGVIEVPRIDYNSCASFGSLHIKDTQYHEPMGQDVDYTKQGTPTAVISVDCLSLSRLDLLKLDVEGMELEVLQGGSDTIDRCHPVIFWETYFDDWPMTLEFVRSKNYTIFPQKRINCIGIHNEDPMLPYFLSQRTPIFFERVQ